MRLVFVVLGLGAGTGIGFFNVGTGNTLVTAVLLAAAAFLLAVLRPAFAWMSATLVGLGVPAAYLWATIAGAVIDYPPQPNLAATLLALLPAVAGALVALALRRVLLGASESRVHR